MFQEKSLIPVGQGPQLQIVERDLLKRRPRKIEKKRAFATLVRSRQELHRGMAVGQAPCDVVGNVMCKI